jgi:hypothetical protein
VLPSDSRDSDLRYDASARLESGIVDSTQTTDVLFKMWSESSETRTSYTSK